MFFNFCIIRCGYELNNLHRLKFYHSSSTFSLIFEMYRDVFKYETDIKRMYHPINL